MKMFLIALMALNLSANIARAQGDAAPAGAEGATGDQIVRKKKGEACPHCKDEKGAKNHKAHGHDKHPNDQHDAKEGTAH